MSNITVNIVIQGLIALSPNYQGNSANHMTALVVDSQWVHPSSECVVEHHPRIEFPTSDADCTANHRANGCQWLGEMCRCPLNRQEIVLAPEVTPELTDFQAGPPEQKLPVTSDTASGGDLMAGDFTYIANFASLGQQVDPRYQRLDQTPPRALAARFTFPFDSLLACDHATRPDNQSDNVHTFQFRQLGIPAESEDLEQAVAQNLIGTVRLEISDEAPSLQLRSFEGGAVYEFPLVPGLVEGVPTIRIELRNHRSSPTDLGDPCDDGIGRDFALFYELLESPPPWFERRIPHVRHSQSAAAKDVVPAKCERFKMPQSRPVCPLVAF